MILIYCLDILIIIIIINILCYFQQRKSRKMIFTKDNKRFSIFIRKKNYS